MTQQSERPKGLPSLLVAALAASCAGTQELADPTLVVYTPQGAELGVSTDFGIVFLGRTARGGDIDLTAWFGDGPSLESTVVEPLGGGLYTAETDIRLPTVPMTFEAPAAGRTVRVMARAGKSTWIEEARVVSDPAVSGILLRPSSRVTGAPEQIGAGVYVGGGLADFKLLGLVSGRVRIETEDGAREYVTVVGPEDLWRLVAHRRSFSHKRRWVYREDIL